MGFMPEFSTGLGYFSINSWSAELSMKKSFITSRPGDKISPPFLQDSILEESSKSVITGASPEATAQYWNPPKVAGERVIKSAYEKNQGRSSAQRLCISLHR